MTTLEKFTEDIQLEIKKVLTPLDLKDGELASLGSAITSVRALLLKMRTFVSGYRFADAPEEIRFFKEIKPVMMSQYIYHKEVFDIRLKCSSLTFEATQRCLHKALHKCRSYLTRHQEFYRYCLSNATHLDTQYFTRAGNLEVNPDADPSFTTAYDSVLSRLVSMQLLADFLTRWMSAAHSDTAGSASTLKWTASKTDLTELIYALQAAEVFNNGSADIKQIARAFESMAGIKLGDYYRTYQAILVRKNDQLAFISRLKNRLQARLNDMV